MIVEIISIGTEILLGDILDSNSRYLAEKLTEMGYDIHYISSVGDNKKKMYKSIRQAVKRSDVVITTGGLGPTDDDLTREVISEVTKRELKFSTDLLNDIEKLFQDRKYHMTDNNRKQAYLPADAKPLKNKKGTAVGILLEMDDYIIISMPGVPREMKSMFENEVVPYLITKNSDVIRSRTLNFFSIGESALETEIKEILDQQDNPTLALLAGDGEVKIRITAKANTEEKVYALIDGKEEEIRGRVGQYIYGTNDRSLEDIIGEMLSKQGLTLAVAESCTGGLVGNRITDIPGSSQYFMGGMIVYSNQAKIEQLGVNNETLDEYGAVSEETAKEMAENVKRIMQTDIGVSLTGIAGPDGGSEEKPVGLVYLGLAVENRTKIYKLNLSKDRIWNKWMSSQNALFYVYKYLLSKEDFA
ncbi:MAG: competence/damage-inducible protein A [bacterium]